jgi:crossover junction endodeoxyribonuclease RuvC
MQTIIGIDPGIERLGWGVVNQDKRNIEYISSGVQKTSPKNPVSDRLVVLYDFLDDLFSTNKPRVVGIEKLFFSKNIKTGIVIGEVRGIILLASAKHNAHIVEFTPPEIKSLVCGSGRADKKQVARMMELTLDLPRRTMLDDETDALAISYAAALTTYPHVGAS